MPERARRVIDDHTVSVRIPASATFAVGTVTETSISGRTIESTIYAPSGTAGLYAVTSETETFIQSGSSTTTATATASIPKLPMAAAARSSWWA